jgi:hypothetical protein
VRGLRPHLEQREEVREVDEPFGFGPLVFRQWLSSILFVEQRVEPAVDTFGQAKPCHPSREVHFDMNRRPAHEGSIAPRGQPCMPAGWCRSSRTWGKPPLSHLRKALIAVYGSDIGAHNVTWRLRFTAAAWQAVSYRERRILRPAGNASTRRSRL